MKVEIVKGWREERGRKKRREGGFRDMREEQE